MLLQHVPCAPPKRYSVRLHVVERSGQKSRTNSHILYRYIIYCGHCTSQLDTPKVPEAQHAWKTRLQSYFLVKVPPQASPALKEKLRPIGLRQLLCLSVIPHHNSSSFTTRTSSHCGGCRLPQTPPPPVASPPQLHTWSSKYCTIWLNEHWSEEVVRD